MKNFDNLTFQEKCEALCSNIDELHDRETMIDFAKYQIDEDRIFLAIHVLQAIDGNSADYWRYDMNMGTLETPTPIEDDDDINEIMEEYSDYITELCESGIF